MTESRAQKAETESASSSRELPITRLTGVLFVRMVRNFATSDVRGRAIARAKKRASACLATFSVGAFQGRWTDSFARVSGYEPCS